MDLRIQAKVMEHLYHVVLQKPFEPGVPFVPQKKEYSETVISQPLKRKKPEEKGVDSAYLCAFLKELETTHSLNLHQVMIVKEGAVICEAAFAPYRMELWHVTHSLCKTVTGMAIGLLVGDGLLNTDDKLIKIFDKEMSPLSKLKLSKLTVHHLLTMSSGAGVNETVLCGESDWLKAYLDTTLRFEPGTKFQYNSMNSYVLSCIVQELTGMTMLEFLRKRLFEPMGIETIQWESCPMGRTKGGWGMYLLPEDMAKLGQLLLQKGEWNSRPLLPKEYVLEMTQKQMDTAPEEGMFGYGYQCWMGKAAGSFLFNGMLGQNVHVIPSLNLVIVVTGGNDHLFGNCAVNEIIYKYFTNREIPGPAGNKNSYHALCEQEQSLKNEFAWLRPRERRSTFASMFRKKERTALPGEAVALAGKAYQLEKQSVRFQPLFAQFLNNCYSKGIEKLSFSVEGENFFFTIVDGTDVNKIAVGFAAPLYSKLSVCGEPYLVAAQGIFATDEDDNMVLKLAVPFIEHSNGRLLKIFFYSGESIGIEWGEFPGKTILSEGAQTMLGGMSETVITQVKAHVDLDLVLALADSLMEPVSLGKQIK